jgi:cysteine-rich repeat protein
MRVPFPLLLAALLVASCSSGDSEDLFGGPAPGAGAGGEGGSEVGGEGGEGGAEPAGAGGSELAGSGGSDPAGAGGAEPAGAGGSDPAGAGGSDPAGAGGDAGQAGASAGPVCGNGVREPGEECDDGDGDEGDGCTSGCKVVCPKQQGVALNPANGHCYWRIKKGIGLGGGWLEQANKCVQAGGYLASLRSAEENEFVRKLHTDREVWIGATDGKGAQEPGVGKYGWISKEPFDYAAWAPGEPNAFAFGCPPVLATCYEHCAVQRTDGLWNDQNCNDGQDAICEWAPPGGG